MLMSNENEVVYRSDVEIQAAFDQMRKDLPEIWSDVIANLTFKEKISIYLALVFTPSSMLLVLSQKLCLRVPFLLEMYCDK